MKLKLMTLTGLVTLSFVSVVPVFAQELDQENGFENSEESAPRPKKKSVSNDALFSDMDKSLFSGSLLSNSPDVAASEDTLIEKSNRRAASRQASNTQAQIAVAEMDQEMRHQMDEVANWLQQYCIRNFNRFPGARTTNDIMYQAQTQLTELVPNNPYNSGITTLSSMSTAEYGSPGVPWQFNADGSPATGTPASMDDWTGHLAAQQMDKIRLQNDPGLNRQQIDYWVSNPPEDWTAPPGTITAIGNYNGLFIVWGADASGKPVKTAGGRPYVVVCNTLNFQDQNAPNEDL